MVSRCHSAYLSVGSNLGDREANLKSAILALGQRGSPVVQQSPIYETEPQDVPEQPWFLNMVVEVAACGNPHTLLARMQKIESDMGRVRSVKNTRGPRVIDLDILLFDDLQLDSEGLVIPHPRMWDRRFVLQPLLDILDDGRVNASLCDLVRRQLGNLEEQEIRRVKTKQS